MSSHALRPMRKAARPAPSGGSSVVSAEPACSPRRRAARAWEARAGRRPRDSRPRISASVCHRSAAAPARGPSRLGGCASEEDGWPAGAGSGAVPRPRAGNTQPLGASVEAQQLPAGGGRAGVRSDVPRTGSRPGSDGELQDHGGLRSSPGRAGSPPLRGPGQEEQAALSAPSAAEPCRLVSTVSAAVPRSGEPSGRRGEAPPPSAAGGHARLLAAEHTAAVRRAPSRRPSAAFPEPAAERWCSADRMA